MVLFLTNAHAHPQAEAAAKESSEGLSLLLLALFIVGIVLCAQLNCMIENRREAFYDKHKQ
jgi:heme/copper-type cytochrome/quinol oxidase subunit 2